MQADPRPGPDRQLTREESPALRFQGCADPVGAFMVYDELRLHHGINTVPEWLLSPASSGPYEVKHSFDIAHA